jgi:hypothetical protein
MQAVYPAFGKSAPHGRRHSPATADAGALAIATAVEWFPMENAVVGDGADDAQLPLMRIAYALVQAPQLQLLQSPCKKSPACGAWRARVSASGVSPCETASARGRRLVAGAASAASSFVEAAAIRAHGHSKCLLNDVPTTSLASRAR